MSRTIRHRKKWHPLTRKTEFTVRGKSHLMTTDPDWLWGHPLPGRLVLDRDGRWSDKGHSIYKEYIRYARRSNERVYLAKFKAGYDIEGIPEPTEKDTKFYTWCVW